LAEPAGNFDATGRTPRRRRRGVPGPGGRRARGPRWSCRNHVWIRRAP